MLCSCVLCTQKRLSSVSRAWRRVSKSFFRCLSERHVVKFLRRTRSKKLSKWMNCNAFWHNRCNDKLRFYCKRINWKLFIKIDSSDNSLNHGYVYLYPKFKEISYPDYFLRVSASNDFLLLEAVPVLEILYSTTTELLSLCLLTKSSVNTR